MNYELVEVAGDNEWRDYHAIRREVLWEARARTGYNDRHSDEYLPANHPLLLTGPDQLPGSTDSERQQHGGTDHVRQPVQ
jgi:hypothetical protein